jgi:hypothetical protein
MKNGGSNFSTLGGSQQEELQKQTRMSTHENQSGVALGAAVCVRLTAILRRRSLRWVASRRSCRNKRE